MGYGGGEVGYGAGEVGYFLNPPMMLPHWGLKPTARARSSGPYKRSVGWEQISLGVTE